MKRPAVYILANRERGTLYTGVTSDLVTRVAEHKSHSIEGFTQRYQVDRLVWFEAHATMLAAIQREKRIKEWRRAWKLKLIEDANPMWEDLYSTIH